LRAKGWKMNGSSAIAESARPKVLYLGGTGRSGSTLLARLLGDRAAYAPVGELRYVWRRGFVENHLCECGRPFRECPFWTAVVADAFGGFDAVDVSSVLRGLRAIDRIRHVPELLSARLQRASFRRHIAYDADVLERLYTSVSAVSGRPIVVDSSKDPSYAYVLHAIARFDLAVVHLVRDSRAVAHSWTRAKPRPEIHWQLETMTRHAPITSALLWDQHNLLFEMFARTGHPFVRVRYEDLVERPDATVSTVAELQGVSTTEANDLGHSISGNPMRFDRGPLRILVDDEWIDALAARDRRAVTLATAPFLAKYGYLRRRAPYKGATKAR
jgi:LPS sulfotransferase NodH